MAPHFITVVALENTIPAPIIGDSQIG